MARKKILNSLQPKTFYPPRGRKEVWLPTWHITLVRTPHLPANMAEFLVPMKINKLDLKDYLFHAYGIPALSVRSSIQQQPIKRKWEQGPFHRPQSTKRMIVEMDTSYRGGPFVWPETPKDFSAWDKQLFEDNEAARESAQRAMGRYGSAAPRKEPGALTEQVEALVQGTQVWKPSWLERGDWSSQQVGVETPQTSKKTAQDEQRTP